ncbi:hypothetical protein [Rhizohabitans arisaemae]|uniref:hypothetical protein n=1 Tax=Rhizohabitans arisaemae TaxID=2720610 RepID=UPI0024B2820F|nr:hypothetical protein [Rhizohabitans arisaemae]
MDRSDRRQSPGSRTVDRQAADLMLNIGAFILVIMWFLLQAAAYGLLLWLAGNWIFGMLQSIWELIPPQFHQATLIALGTVAGLLVLIVAVSAVVNLSSASSPSALTRTPDDHPGSDGHTAGDWNAADLG